MRNLHKFYYKDYFSPDRLDWALEKMKTAENNVKVIKKNNKTLCDPIQGFSNPIEKNPQVNADLPLKIQYPGLVTGIGINHEIGVEGEYKLGMHFDWTYGMPIIYGSSVKGVLKSWFAEFYKKKYQDDDSLISKLIDDIFEGGKKSIYQRDIFFDAVIVKSNSQGKILASDSITPHGENPLKNPIPITFMKIAPGCTLEFRFRLSDTEVDGKKFGAELKRELFKDILTTVGIGAKTNVGYGQLKIVD